MVWRALKVASSTSIGPHTVMHARLTPPSMRVLHPVLADDHVNRLRESEQLNIRLQHLSPAHKSRRGNDHCDNALNSSTSRPSRARARWRFASVGTSMGYRRTHEVPATESPRCSCKTELINSE
jgi:hypothetical protein